MDSLVGQAETSNRNTKREALKFINFCKQNGRFGWKIYLPSQEDTSYWQLSTFLMNSCRI